MCIRDSHVAFQQKMLFRNRFAHAAERRNVCISLIMRAVACVSRRSRAPQRDSAHLIHCGCIYPSFNQKARWSLRWIDVLITQALESPRFSHISVTLRFSHRAKLRGTMPPGIMSSPGPPRRQSKHRQLVIQSTQALATSYTSISSTRN